jgi:hypothetical protein
MPDEDQCDTLETHQVRSSTLCGHNCPGMKETTFVDHLRCLITNDNEKKKYERYLYKTL